MCRPPSLQIRSVLAYGNWSTSYHVCLPPWKITAFLRFIHALLERRTYQNTPIALLFEGQTGNSGSNSLSWASARMSQDQGLYFFVEFSFGCNRFRLSIVYTFCTTSFDRSSVNGSTCCYHDANNGGVSEARLCSWKKLSLAFISVRHGGRCQVLHTGSCRLQHRKYVWQPVDTGLLHYQCAFLCALWAHSIGCIQCTRMYSRLTCFIEECFYDKLK